MQTPACASKPQTRALLILASSYTVPSYSFLTPTCVYLSSASSPLSLLKTALTSHPLGHAPYARFLLTLKIYETDATFCYPSTCSRRHSASQERNLLEETPLGPAAGSPGLYKPQIHQLAVDVTTCIAFGYLIFLHPLIRT